MTPRFVDQDRTKLMGQTREKIISAAVNEIAMEGFEAASVKRITQTAGVATGTIYNYFPSKKDLMLAPAARNWISSLRLYCRTNPPGTGLCFAGERFV